jgi:ribonuclease I
MTRPSSEHPLKTALLMLLALSILAAGATARHRKSSDAEPGTFDYYLLSLSWSPAAIAAEFLRANPKLSASSVVVACSRQGDAVRGACRAATLIVLPVR